MINNFKHKGLKELFYDGKSKLLPNKYYSRLVLILDRLDAMAKIEDMNFPGSYLHPLKGELKGFYSVRVTANWRIVFRFENGKVYDVNFVDYH